MQDTSYNYTLIRNLPSGKFFVLLFNGIYIYEYDFSKYEKIYKFKGNQIIHTEEDKNKTAITEIEYKNNYYIACLVKNFLYLFDNDKNSILNEIDLTSNLTGIYYELNFYSNNSALSCIITYIENIIYESYNIYRLTFYKIDFLDNFENIIIKKNTYFNKTYIEKYGESFISDIYFSSHIYNDFLLCFYIVKGSEEISLTGFNIKDKFEITNIYNTIFSSEDITKIINLKTVISEEKILIFLYANFFIMFENEIKKTNHYNYNFGIYYDITYNIFKEIENLYYNLCYNYDIYYFQKTKDYYLTCYDNNKIISLHKYNKYLESRIIYLINNFTCEIINNFIIFYNNFSNSYNLISDCFTKTNSNVLFNISFSNKEKSTEYIDINTAKNSKALNLYLNITKSELINKIPEIIEQIEIGENYTLIGEDFNIIIKPTNSSYMENSTHLNFQKCENILRNNSKMDISRILTLFQVEIDNINEQSLVNQVEYQIYDDNKTLLDLSLCDNTDIEIFYSLKDDTYSLSSYNHFKYSNIDIFNINDSFFNDICRPYSVNNNDVVLEDRIKDIYQNYSLCDEGCVFKEIDFENKTIICNCNVKNNLSVEEPVLNIIYFDDIKVESNFGLIKCYDLVLSFNGKYKNIGFWIFTILIITQIPFIFIYFCKGLQSIREYIINQMIKYGYIEKNKTNINSSNNINRKRKKSKTHNINIKRNNIHSPIKKNKKRNKNDIKDNSSINKFKVSDREMIKEDNIINNINADENNENINNKINKKKSRRMKKWKTSKKKISNKKILINNVILLKNDKKKKHKRNINKLPTEVIDKKDKEKNEETEKDNNTINYNLININLNNIKAFTPKSSLYILNNYTFEEAIKYDMRSICAIFYIFLLSKQSICHAFLFRSPLVLFPIRFCLLVFIFASDLALNAFFYLDDKISKKYNYVQNLFLFTFNNNITIILLSTFIGFIFMTIFTNLNNSTNKLRDVFRKEEDKLLKNKNYKVTTIRKKEILTEIDKILKIHKIKVIIIIITEISLILFFWYYVTAFCHVYSSTQTSWLLDSFLSILSRLIIELLLSLGFAKLYRIAVEANIQTIYKFVLFFYSCG